MHWWQNQIEQSKIQHQEMQTKMRYTRHIMASRVLPRRSQSILKIQRKKKRTPQVRKRHALENLWRTLGKDKIWPRQQKNWTSSTFLEKSDGLDTKLPTLLAWS
jgi:hypothetical protein